jgi:hypothetical protein
MNEHSASRIRTSAFDSRRQTLTAFSDGQFDPLKGLSQYEITGYQSIRLRLRDDVVFRVRSEDTGKSALTQIDVGRNCPLREESNFVSEP